MAISPITSVLPRNNNIQQTSFGKKEKKTNLPETRSSVISKAIPSAALVLASMSPAAGANSYPASPENPDMFTIEQAEYNINEDEMSTSTINFQDSQLFKPVNILIREGVNEPTDVAKPNTFQVICFNDPDKNSDKTVVTRISVSRGLHNPCTIKSLNMYHINLTGDDGIAGRPIIIPYIKGNNIETRGQEDDYYGPELYKYIDKIVKNQDPRVGGYDGDITREEEHLDVRPDGNGKMKSTKVDTEWIRFGRRISEDFGKSVGDPIKVNTPRGNYTIKMYDNDGDGENFETLTIKKDGQPEFKVAGVSVVLYDIMMGRKDYTPKNYLRGSISLYKRNSKEKAVILNDKLLKELLKIYRMDNFNNAYENQAYKTSIVLSNLKNEIKYIYPSAIKDAHPTEKEFEVWKD